MAAGSQHQLTMDFVLFEEPGPHPWLKEFQMNEMDHNEQICTYEYIIYACIYIYVCVCVEKYTQLSFSDGHGGSS